MHSSLARIPTKDSWMMEKSYEYAITLLNSRRRFKTPKPKTLLSWDPLGPPLMPHASSNPVSRVTPGSIGVRQWLQKLGYLDDDINNLNIIHVAGTKGKGSTCAFADSFLRAHKQRTGFSQRIGLYTSPHLQRVQERIQVNSTPLSEDVFAKYLFEVWDRLSSLGGNQKLPAYKQLLMLVSVHAFIAEKVEVAIYETHHGGQFDVTNVIQQPVVTGITMIAMDHIEQLGPSIEHIAWHKAGIMKEGRPAFASTQQPSVTGVLRHRAAEKRAELTFVNVNPSLPNASSVLNAEVQKMNSSLAIALVNAYLGERGPKEHRAMIFQDIELGIEQLFWPGRFQRIADGNSEWFLNGAHNDLSVQKAAQWYAMNGSKRQIDAAPLARVLIFSQLSGRDGAALLRGIARALQENGCRMQHVIFSTYEERLDETIRKDRCFKMPEKNVQEIFQSYEQAWRSIDATTKISIEPTIEGALKLARNIGDGGNGMQTLITGSLYLVGGALLFLEPNGPVRS